MKILLSYGDDTPPLGIKVFKDIVGDSPVAVGFITGYEDGTMDGPDLVHVKLDAQLTVALPYEASTRIETGSAVNINAETGQVNEIDGTEVPFTLDKPKPAHRQSSPASSEPDYFDIA